jgi:hypothetical protein
MKFVIFADKSYNYIRPISDGLHRTLQREGHESIIWYNGIHWLNKMNLIEVLIRDIYYFFKNLRHRNSKKYIYRFLSLLTFNTREKRKSLKECDCIIVVNNCPRIFYSKSLKRLEEIRLKYQKPIVNYDFHYLPNQAWYERIIKDPYHFGLERFDWYLPVGIVTEFAIPKKIPRLYSSIGMDIKSHDLYPQQNKFQALIDFERKGYEEYRSLVIEVLNELDIPYIELKGKYTTDEIRSIYRKSSIYFISFRESFGLPIVELQLCGSYIFTPYKEWCPAHFLEKSPFEKGVGKLGSNFFVYDNNSELLKKQILEIKHNYDANQVINKFKEEYYDYYSINIDQLNDFIYRLASGTIHAHSHIKYKKYNKYISTDDKIILY